VTFIVNVDGMGRSLLGRWRCARRGHPFVAMTITATWDDTSRSEPDSQITEFRCACGKRHTEHKDKP
jgi:hypothetical protein